MASLRVILKISLFLSVVLYNKSSFAEETPSAKDFYEYSVQTIDGKSYSLAELRGKVPIFVIFFAKWK